MILTRLNTFARSWLFNVTAVAAQRHSQQTNSQSLATRHHAPSAQCVVFSPRKINRGPTPHLGTAMQTTFSRRYRLVKVSRKISRSRERLCHIF